MNRYLLFIRNKLDYKKRNFKKQKNKEDIDLDIFITVILI